MSERQSQLTDSEVAIIRAMLASGSFAKQEILAHFSKPGRSLNPARINEIKDDHKRYNGISAASNDDLDRFLVKWKTSTQSADLNPTDPRILKQRFPIRAGAPIKLAISETSTVEGKESFNWGNKHDYCKTLAGMANNQGGYILFGVKDGSFEVVGISPDRMERFDLKKANESISRTFNQALELEKGQFEIEGRTIGVLYVKASTTKPVLCTLDGNSLFSGDIFYRYPGETRRIQAPELEALLKERDTAAGNRLLHLVSRLAESGAQNAAVINLSTGEVTGERGQLVIEESLLDKIKFVTEGRLDDKDGAPALRVVGDVQTIKAPSVTIQKSVVGYTTERHIHDAFLQGSCEHDPKIYIEAQTHLQPLWLPIFFFAVEANVDLSDLTKILRNSGSPYEGRIDKHVERVTLGKSPSGTPSMVTIQAEFDAIINVGSIEVPDVSASKRFLQAMRAIRPEHAPLGRILQILSHLRTRFGNNKEFIADFRYALASVDLQYFRKRLVG